MLNRTKSGNQCSREGVALVSHRSRGDEKVAAVPQDPLSLARL